MQVSENTILNENSSESFTKGETCLLNKKQFQSLNLTTDILEKYQKLEKFYHTNEKLRITIKKDIKKFTKS